jgi:hypothetical protein
VIRRPRRRAGPCDWDVRGRLTNWTSTRYLRTRHAGSGTVVPQFSHNALHWPPGQFTRERTALCASPSPAPPCPPPNPQTTPPPSRRSGSSHIATCPSLERVSLESESALRLRDVFSGTARVLSAVQRSPAVDGAERTPIRTEPKKRTRVGQLTAQSTRLTRANPPRGHR